MLLGGTIEFIIRRIPNDYVYKKVYLEKNSEKLEVLILGTSHAYYGINPVYINAKSFNASHVSQSLNYDYAIFNKYQDHWDHLQYIVLPISYFSLFFNLDSSPEAWRVKNYEIYYGMTSSRKISDYFELFSNKTPINLERIKSYYWDGQTNITCSELGWGVGYNSNPLQNLGEGGKSAAERHDSVSNKINVSENLNILNDFINYAKEKGIQIFFFTPPAYHTYFENLNKEQLNQTIAIMTELDKQNQNVVYVNYLQDPSFTEKDFYNEDHLNEIGAEKLTRKIDKLISIH